MIDSGNGGSVVNVTSIVSVDFIKNVFIAVFNTFLYTGWKTVISELFCFLYFKSGIGHANKDYGRGVGTT